MGLRAEAIEAASPRPAQPNGGEKMLQRKTRIFVSSGEAKGNRNHTYLVKLRGAEVCPNDSRLLLMLKLNLHR